jgi:NitT/TauT family transport system permease protein
MYRLVIGFTLSIIIGVSVGLAMVKFPGFSKTMSSQSVYNHFLVWHSAHSLYY